MILVDHNIAVIDHNFSLIISTKTYCIVDNLTQHRVTFLGFYLSDKIIAATSDLKIKLDLFLFFVPSSLIYSAAQLQTLLTC